TIVVIEVFGVVLAAVIAYGIAALGLSPLRRFAARAEQMSTSRLAHPLPELDTSGELKELEHAFNGMLARLNESFTRLSQFSS
ncbi:HAMP domain-containing protein, partial [Burkholderia cenocepacia]